jgi:hypothetical protein
LTDSDDDVIDGKSFVEQKGICSEMSLTYDITKYNIQPPDSFLTEALNHKISSYYTIATNSIKSQDFIILHDCY